MPYSRETLLKAFCVANTHEKMTKVAQDLLDLARDLENEVAMTRLKNQHLTVQVQNQVRMIAGLENALKGPMKEAA